MDTILHNKSLSEKFSKAEIYNKWADTYDEYVTSIGYNGPENFAREFCDLVKKPHIRVLDFGCGTGLLGNEIKNLFNGEMELIGVDISENMIKNANKKNCYSQIFNCNLDEMELNEIRNLLGTFDYIVSCGVSLEGHVGFHIFKKLSKIVNENIIFTVRESYMIEDYENYNKYVSNNSTYIEQDIDYLDNVRCKLVII